MLEQLIQEIKEGLVTIQVTKKDDVYTYICNKCTSWTKKTILVSVYKCPYCDALPNDKIFLVCISKPSRLNKHNR